MMFPWPAQATALIAKPDMHLIQIDLANRHFIRRVLKIVSEKLEIGFVHFVHQMHGQVIEEGFDRVGTLWSMVRALIETRDVSQLHRLRSMDGVQNILHAVVELLCPENTIVTPTVDDECTYVP